MMKSAAALAIVLMVLSVVCPSPAPAVQAQTNWRNRISSEEGLVATTDIIEEIRFGRAVAARIIGRYGLYENPQIMKYVNLVGQTLARSANRPEIEFNFAVLNTDEIMSFGAPGGYIFVTRGALLAMQDEAELAGVLAHELGHIAEKTAVRVLKIRAIEDTGVSGLAQIIGSSADQARVAFLRAVNKAMDLLLKDGYRREEEAKADEDAALFCAMAGYDPSGLLRYIERTHGVREHETGELDKTPPSFEARVNLLKEFILLEGIDSGDYKTYAGRFTRNMSGVQ